MGTAVLTSAGVAVQRRCGPAVGARNNIGRQHSDLSHGAEPIAADNP